MKVKFKEIIKKQKVTDYEKKIAKELKNNKEKHFNKEGNLCTCQTLFGIREAFRGLVVKEWVTTPN